MKTNARRLAVLFTVACLHLPAARAETAPAPAPEATLVAEQQAAIRNCLQLIRLCQLRDGAFRMKAEGDPVWIQPYFGNYAALALLAGKDARDLDRVATWLGWYAKHQRADGSINDFEGGLAQGYKDNGKRDSVDAYAATFLLAAQRYHSVRETLPLGVAEAARKALDAIRSVTDEDGLTWAKPDYKVKLLQDNVVTYGGLAAAARLFQVLGDTPRADEARQMHQKLGAQLPRYIQQDEKGKTFAYALHQNGTFEMRDAAAGNFLATEGMAILFGLAWISDADRTPWQRLENQNPDTGVAPQAPVERWYIAALHADTNPDITRRKTVAEAKAFVFNARDAQNDVYLHRPAIAALALLEGSKWLPSVNGKDIGPK